jgi:hypothetical protein
MSAAFEKEYTNVIPGLFTIGFEETEINLGKRMCTPVNTS